MKLAFLQLLLLVSVFGESCWSDVSNKSLEGKDYSRSRSITVTPLFKHLGVQEFLLTDIEAEIMTPSRHEEFCQLAMKDEHLQLRKLYEGKVMFVSEVLSQTCGGRLGLYTNFNHFHYWCDLNAYIIFTNNKDDMHTFFIGYYFRQHDGTKFKAKYKRHPSLKQCAIFETQVSARFTSFIEGDDKPDTYTNSNLSSITSYPYMSMTYDVCGHREPNDLFDTLHVFFLFRILFSGLFIAVSIRAAYFIISDIRKGYPLSNIHRLVLWVNFTTMFFLGSLEFLGMHRMFDTTGVKFQNIAFFGFFGTSVATDFILSVLYDKVISHLKARRTRRKQNLDQIRFWFFMFVAYIITAIDIVAAGYQVRVSAAVYVVLYEILPLTFVSCQIAVNMYLIYQVRQLVLVVLNGSILLKNTKESVRIKQYDASQKLVKRFSFWVPVSVLCATVSVGMWILWYLQMVTKTKTLWIKLWSLLLLAKLGNVWAQVEVCVPPSRERPSSKSSSSEKPEDKVGLS